MEATKKSSKNSLFKRLGFSGIGLSALLCSLPIISAALGIGALTAAAAYSERIGLAVLILSVGVLGYWLYKKRKPVAAPIGDINCDCKTESQASSKS